MNKVLRLSLVAALSAGMLTACGGTQVKRVDSNKEIALTDRWNDTDSQLVSKEMIGALANIIKLIKKELDDAEKKKK